MTFSKNSLSFFEGLLCLDVLGSPHMLHVLQGSFCFGFTDGGTEALRRIITYSRSYSYLVISQSKPRSS